MTDINLRELPHKSSKELRAIWTELGVRGDPPRVRQLLVRGISWHIQEPIHGGFDAETRRLLRAAIRNAPKPKKQGDREPIRKIRNTLELRPGTTLVRTWRGHEHEVVVLEHGKRYRYRDAEYASLSEIAREITGARWSGPRFFGLISLKGSK